MIKIPGKIPIIISPFFWLLAIFIGYINTLSIPGTALWTVIILLSVLIHEYGHALTAWAFGQNARIELVAFGGVTHRHGGGKISNWKEFLIVLNGPLAGFALALASLALYSKFEVSHPQSTITYVLGITWLINLFWTIVNLLPIQPLDGGKLLLVFLDGFFGLNGRKTAFLISFIFALGMSIFFFSIQQLLPAMLFVFFTFESFRVWKSSLALSKQDDNFILQHLHKEASRELKEGHRDAALGKFMRIRDLAKSGMLYHSSTESAAQILAEQGDEKTAYDFLISLGSKITPEGMRLLHQLAYRKGEWKEAILVGDKAYHYFPEYDIAIINASCHGILGHVRPAIGWLQCAVKEGVPNLKEVLASKEFDPIREDPLFREFSLKQ